jgi:hypothetical protein
MARVRYDEFRAWIDELKVTRGCVDCGYRAHPAALDFDHRVGTTKAFNIASSAGRRREALEAEIAKCDVRCSNCHRIKTLRTSPSPGRPIDPNSKRQKRLNAPRKPKLSSLEHAVEQHRERILAELSVSLGDLGA